MKPFQRLCAGVVLTLAFAMTAFAEGHMGTPRTEPPPSSPTSATTEGGMDCPIKSLDTTDGPAADSITKTVLNLIEDVLALL